MVEAVARATGASRGTIRRGIRELGQPAVGAAKGREGPHPPLEAAGSAPSA